MSASILGLLRQNNYLFGMDEASINEISQSIENALLTDLKDLTAEQIDALTDQLFDGPLSELPWIGSAVKTLKFVKNIRETIFNKKVLHFLVEASKGNTDTMCDTIGEINNDPSNEQKFGESVIMIIDKLTSITQAKLIGRCLKYLDKKTINYDEYSSLCYVIQQLSMGEIKLLVQLEDLDHYTRNVSNKINYKLLESLGIITIEYDITSAVERTISSSNRRNEVKIGGRGNSKKALTWLGRIFFYIIQDKDFDERIELYRPRPFIE